MYSPSREKSNKEFYKIYFHINSNINFSFLGKCQNLQKLEKNSYFQHLDFYNKNDFMKLKINVNSLPYSNKTFTRI